MPSLLCRQPQKHSRGSASTTRYSRNRAPTSIARRRAQKCRMPLYKSAIESQLDIQICSTTPSHAQPLRPRATPKTWEFPFERKLYNFRNSRNGPPSQARGPPYPDLCIADICVPCVLARPSAMQPLTHGAANENCPGPTSSLCRAGAYTAGLASNNFTYTGSQAPTSSLDGTDAAILNLPIRNDELSSGGRRGDEHRDGHRQKKRKLRQRHGRPGGAGVERGAGIEIAPH